MVDARNILVQNKIIETKERKLPKDFYPANLTKKNQFFTWGKVYRKVIPGSDDGYVRTLCKDHTMKFLRDENVKLDVSNRRYSREKVTLTKCKYTDKLCLCLDVAVLTPITDGVGKTQ